MNKKMVVKGIIFTFFVLAFLRFSSPAGALVSLPDIDKDIKIPLLPTATPTLVIKFKVPTKFFIPTGFFMATNTPVPATPTPTTVIPTETPVLTKAKAQATETPEPTISTSGLTPMPTPTPNKTGVKEIAFLGTIGLLILIIIFQSQWSNIKNWLHRKTE